MVYAVIDTNVFVAALLTKNDDSATVTLSSKEYNSLQEKLENAELI